MICSRLAVLVVGWCYAVLYVDCRFAVWLVLVWCYFISFGLVYYVWCFDFRGVVIITLVTGGGLCFDCVCVIYLYLRYLCCWLSDLFAFVRVVGLCLLYALLLDAYLIFRFAVGICFNTGVVGLFYLFCVCDTVCFGVVVSVCFVCISWFGALQLIWLVVYCFDACGLIVWCILGLLLISCVVVVFIAICFLLWLLPISFVGCFEFCWLWWCYVLILLFIMPLVFTLLVVCCVVLGVDWTVVWV